MKALYIDHKSSMKKIDDINGKIFYAHGLKELILKCLYYPKQHTDSMQSLQYWKPFFIKIE